MKITLPSLRDTLGLLAAVFIVNCNIAPPGSGFVAETGIFSGPAATTSQRDATIRFHAGQGADPEFTYSLDGGPETRHPGFEVHFTGLGLGVHTFSVAANSRSAGESSRDPTPATHTWTIVAGPAPTGGGADLSFSKTGVPGGGMPSIDGDVNLLAIQPDGEILAAGSFSSVNGEPRAGLVRFDASGLLEDTTAFNPGPENAGNSIQAMAVQPDGRILIAGFFTQWNGVPRGGIARLMPNGELDTFGAGAGANAAVQGLLLLPGGQILIRGQFFTVHGLPRQGLARLNTDGTLDTTFHTDVDGSITSMALDPDGNVLICGVISAVGGQPHKHLVRLNMPEGTVDATFVPALPSSAYCFNVCVQPNGHILVAGYLPGPGGDNRGMVRLMPNGVEEGVGTFHPPVIQGIQVMALQEDGHLIIGGEFYEIAGQVRNGLARLLPNGGLEGLDSFANGSGVGSVGAVHDLALQRDGKIIVAGDFSEMNGVPCSNIARVLNEGASDTLTPIGGGAAEWSVSGPFPALHSVRFSLNTGNDWQDLGMAERTETGWRREGLILPVVGKLRASGRTANGVGNAGLIEQTVSLEIPAIAWRERTFGPDAQNEEIAGDDEDADHDGISNIAEYSGGSDPLNASSVPFMRTEVGPAGLSLIYDRALEATDVEVVMQRSADLSTWTPAAFTEEELSRNIVKRTMRATVPVDFSARRAFVRGTVTHLFPGPAIAVAQPATLRLASGVSTVAYGPVLTTQSLAKVFTVKNRGLAPLTVTALALAGGEAGDYGLVPPVLPLVLAPGAQTTFTAAFAPTATGTRSTTLSLTSNDPDEAVFTLALTGTGTVVMAPEITVEQPAGTELSDGATAHCGTANPLTEAPEKWFTVCNTGNVPLNVNDITVSGAHADDFPLSGGFQVPAVLAPNESLTFRIVFFPGAEGNRSASLSIASNDADEGTFDLTLTGRGNTPPALQLPASPVNVAAASTAGAVVNFSVTATDTEDAVPPTPVSTPTSGTLFPMGETTVDVTVADSLGRTAAGSFTVRVHPVAAPGTLALWGLDSPQPGLTFTSLADVPAINAGGTGSFSAYLSDGNTGIYSGTFGSLSTLALTGTQAPGTPAGVTFWYFGSAGPRPLNAAGQSAFAAGLFGDGVGFDNATGLWHGAAGGLALLAREGNVAPGTSAGAFFGGFTEHPALNDSGACAFYATLTGPDVDGFNSAGIWIGSPGSLTLLARLGAATPGVAGETFTELGRPVLNAAGQGLFPGTASTSGRGLWAGSPGSVALVALIGAAAPGLPGVTYSWNFADRLGQVRPVLNGQGRVAYAAYLYAEDIVPGTEWSLWTGPANAPALLARSGQAAPGAAGVFTDFGSPLINSTGAVTFHANTAVALGDPVSGDGLWRGTPGSLTKIVRTGDPAPGAGAGVTFAVLNGGTGSSVENAAVNDSGETVFMAQLAGASITTDNDDSLWHASAAGVLTLLAREGDILNPSPGDPRTVASLAFAGSTTGGSSGHDGQSAGLSASGQTIVRANFTDGTSAVIVLPRP